MHKHGHRLGGLPTIFWVSLVFLVTVFHLFLFKLVYNEHCTSFSAPAQKHHVIAMHKHGHRLGGLPTIFWVSLVFLVTVFHLFLFKLVYNEHCTFVPAPAQEHHVIAMHKHGHRLGGLPTIFWVSLVFLVTAFHLFLFKLVYNEHCTSFSAPAQKHHVIAMHKHGHRLGGLPTIFWVSLVFLVTVFHLFLFKLVYNEHCTSVPAPAQEHHVIAMHKPGYRLGGLSTIFWVSVVFPVTVFHLFLFKLVYSEYCTSVLAPAQEHHVIAMHKHGHRLGGLPTIFWVSLVFLVTVFHLFLFNLVYNEHCTSFSAPAQKHHVIAMHKNGHRLGGLPTIFWVSLVFLVTVFHLFLFKLVYNEYCTSVSAPAQEHHVIAMHKHGHRLGGLPTIFWVSLVFLVTVFHLFLFKLVYNEHCTSVPAPAQEHHVIAMHKHGHRLGGLPTIFWVSLVFLVTVFHLFLFKLVYNEYCTSVSAPAQEHHVIAMHKHGHRLGGLPTIFWVSLVFLVTVFHLFLFKLVYNEHCTSVSAPAQEHHVIAMHKHGHRLGGLPTIFWVSLVVLVTVFYLFLFKLVYNEHCTSVPAPAQEHHVIAMHKHGHRLGGLPTIFWVSLVFLVTVFHLFLFKLVYNEHCTSVSAPVQEHHVIAMHKHGHRLGGLPTIFWVSLVVLVTVFHLFLFKLVYNEHCTSVSAPAQEHHVIAMHKHGHRLGGLPTIFWVSLVVLVTVFHLFLFKLVYNEYCAAENRPYYHQRGRYAV